MADRIRVLVDAVCRGASLREAAALAGVSRPTARAWWRDAAGMSMQYGAAGGLADPLPAFESSEPPPAGRRLSLLEREVIAHRLAAGVVPAAIARELGRHRSTIGAEIARNSGPDGSYFASVAEVSARRRARRPKPFKLHDPVLAARVTVWMDEGWSPKLIADVLAEDTAGSGAGETLRVSHETIYKALYVQTRGSLRADLAQQLSTKRTARKSTTATRRGNGLYADAFTISERPAEVEDRAVPGHWEGDLICGTGNRSAIGTLVERSSRFTILLHLPDRHDAESVATAMIAAMKDLPDHLRRSITWDRGTELADYEQIQLALDAPVFFCDPHSPWQRGTNENTNRLLRHWFEKGTDLSVWTPADLARIQASLNARPRPTLGLKTPAQALNEHLRLAA